MLREQGKTKEPPNASRSDKWTTASKNMIQAEGNGNLPI